MVRAWMLALLGVVGCYEAATFSDAVQPVAPDGDVTLDTALDAMPVAGLIAHYPMDDLGGGMEAIDATGLGHTGTCTTCPTVSPGQIGSSFVFDGVSRIDVPPAADLETAVFTVAAWLRFAVIPSAGFACPLNKVFGTSNQNSWQLCVQSGASFMFGSAIPGAGMDLMNATAPMPAANIWYHVALTWDGTTKRLWVDGDEVANRAVGIDFDMRGLTFGADFDNGAQSSVFSGQIDDVRIYNRVLSDNEIATLASD